MGRVLPVVLFLVACGGGEKERLELPDEGLVCLRLQSDGTVKADVQFRHCLTSCDVAKPATCAIGKDGGSLVVTGRGVVETTGASVCTTDCGVLSASCASTETFAPGVYEVQRGQASTELTLGSQTSCVFGE